MVALVVAPELSMRERLKLTLRLQLDLPDVCDIRDADVCIINDAPLVLQGKVVCEGVLVFSRADQERAGGYGPLCQGLGGNGAGRV
jgi:hypothetical protein